MEKGEMGRSSWVLLAASPNSSSKSKTSKIKHLPLLRGTTPAMLRVTPDLDWRRDVMVQIPGSGRGRQGKKRTDLELDHGR
jgi:hypothetical protein